MKIDKEQLVKVIDFWQKSVRRQDLLPRDVLEKIDYSNKEIIDFVGPRRSGKSSVLKLIIKRLNLSDNFLYLNFEDPFFLINNDPQVIEELIFVFKEYFNQGLRYLFFDEIQEINNWERVIRKLRDGENFKIFITGSSSKLLSGEISSLLTGRHLSYKIFPLSFKEFIAFKELKLEDRKDFILKEKIILKKFDEYLGIGGFPEVVLTNNQELLKNYFFDILQKDIIMRYNVREKDILEKIAVYLLTNAGNILSIESLKDTFNISFASASSYLEYLKSSFLVFNLPQFSYSLKKQSKTLKKIYAIDTGLANNVSFKFSEDKGRMLENVVFLELKNKEDEVYYYKTRNNLEVDFLVKEKSAIKELIQVSWSLSDKKTKKRELKSLLLAMEELKLTQSTLLTYNEEDVLQIGNSLITIKPVFKWLVSSENKVIS